VEIMILLLMLLPVFIAVALIVMGLVVSLVTMKHPTENDPKPRFRAPVVVGCGLALIVLPMVSVQFMYLIFIGPPIGLVMLVIGLLLMAKGRARRARTSRQP